MLCLGRSSLVNMMITNDDDWQLFYPQKRHPRHGRQYLPGMTDAGVIPPVTIILKDTQLAFLRGTFSPLAVARTGSSFTILLGWKILPREWQTKILSEPGILSNCAKRWNEMLRSPTFSRKEKFSSKSQSACASSKASSIQSTTPPCSYKKKL